MTEQDKVNEQDKVRMCVDVDADLKNRVKAQADRMGITMGELLQGLALSKNSLWELEAEYSDSPSSQ